MNDAIKGAAAGAIDALKSSPILLAFVLTQFMVLGMVLWIGHETRANDHERFTLLLKQCAPAGG